MANVNTGLFKAARSLSHYFFVQAERDDGTDWDILDTLMQGLRDQIRAAQRRAKNRADGTSRPWFTVIYDDGKGVMMTHVQASSLEVVFAKCPDALFVLQGYKVDLIERRAQRG